MSASKGQSDAGRSPAAASDDRQERALIEAWRQGDREAISTLLRGYQGRVYAVCYRMLREGDEAADLTQEAMVRILDGLHTFDGRSQVSTWIIRVTMNCCLSHLRKRKLRRHVSLDDPGQRSGSWGTIGAALSGSGSRPALGAATSTSGGTLGTTGGGGAEPTGASRVELDERRHALLRGLARLDADMRAIIVLRDTQGLDYQQIGDVLDVPVGTVKSRLFRARAALRGLVEEELGSEGPDSPQGPEEPPRPARRRGQQARED